MVFQVLKNSVGGRKVKLGSILNSNVKLQYFAAYTNNNFYDGSYIRLILRHVRPFSLNVCRHKRLTINFLPTAAYRPFAPDSKQCKYLTIVADRPWYKASLINACPMLTSCNPGIFAAK